MNLTDVCTVISNVGIPRAISVFEEEAKSKLVIDLGSLMFVSKETN
jgi:hypothetical protein